MSLSYPFATFLILLVISIFTTGIYFTNIYIGYIQAIDTNKKLVAEKQYYSSQVEEALDILNRVQNVEVQLRGMLGMKTTRNIIENYHIGGTGNVNLPDEIDSIFERTRFEANMREVRREAWEQQQSVKSIENFIDRKKDILLSTPSIWPIFGYMTSSYGWRTHPITHRKEFHKAIDMFSIQGRTTPIRATAQGRVIVSGWAGSFGKIVIIDHGNGFSTRYCHCSSMIVKQGDEVEQGQIIAYIGNTGLSTGPHLHYEVWHCGKPVNPIRFVRGR